MIAPVARSATTQGRSLVAALAARPSDGPSRVEPLMSAQATRLGRRADVLAQLIAQKENMAQWRDKRRATPLEAAAAYRSAAANLAVPPRPVAFATA